MHDPMCVAWDVPFPFPRRWKYDDARPGEPRWTLGRMRRTNPDNLGEPVYAWFRPAGYRPRVAGHAYRARTLCTIWHVEPNDRDSGSVCKHWADGKPVKAWRWHVWHWRIQVPVLQGFRARLFDRCEMCGRKGRPNHSFQWDSRPLGWRKWRSRAGLYHRECADLHMIAPQRRGGPPHHRGAVRRLPGHDRRVRRRAARPPDAQPGRRVGVVRGLPLAEHARVRARRQLPTGPQVVTAIPPDARKEAES